MSNENTPFLSFIIPYYNLPLKMLCDCIDSICRLPMNDCEREIIVVDDGSEKNIETQLRDEGFEIVYLRKQNGGLSSARNAGLNIAKGKYIQFVDADDRLYTANYAHCLDHLRNETPDMLVFDFCRSEEEVLTTEPKTNETMSGTEYMANNNIRASACGYVSRKSTIGSLRFTKGILHEDEEFTPQLLLQAEKIIISDLKCYIYTVREDSITNLSDSSHTEIRMRDRLATLRKLHTISQNLNGQKRLALERRVAQLTMDDIYNAIILKKSYNSLQKRINELSHNGLFPLPDHNYTTKYTWFRRLTNTQLGLRILALTLPLMSRER